MNKRIATWRNNVRSERAAASGDCIQGNVARRLLIIGLTATSLGFGVGTGTDVLAAQRGDYLDALEAEAGNASAADTRNQKQRAAQEPQQILGELPPNLDMPGFEDALRRQLFGSYLFYKKLSDGNKRAVYSEYQKNRGIENIRNKIANLFTGG